MLRTFAWGDRLRLFQALGCTSLHSEIVSILPSYVAHCSSVVARQTAEQDQSKAAAAAAAAAAAPAAAAPLEPSLTTYSQQAVNVWQQIAGLASCEAQQLLAKQPQLKTFLQADFSSSTFAHNLHLLRCQGIVQLPLPAELRACLALVPHQTLQQVLDGPSMQQLLLQYKQQPHAHTVRVLQQLTGHLQTLMAHAKKRQLQQQQQKQLIDLLLEHIARQEAHDREHSKMKQRSTKHGSHSSRQQQQQQQKQQQHNTKVKQQQTPLDSSGAQFLQVAQAVVDALGLSLAQQTAAAAEGQPPAESSSSSSSARRRPSRSSRRTRSSSSSSAYVDSSSSSEDVLLFESEVQQLAAALARAARNVANRGKLAPQPGYAASYASQVAAAAGMAPDDVLTLLLQRPSLLWSPGKSAAAATASSPTAPAAYPTAAAADPTATAAAAAAEPAAAGPGEMLQLLRSQLPELPLPQLLQRTPGLLAVSKDQAEGVLTLLLQRLKLTKQQAADVLTKHPRLLIVGAGAASLNLGFLVGLGLRQQELQRMLLRSAEWLTRPLQEVTAQWQFVSTVAKVRRDLFVGSFVLRMCGVDLGYHGRCRR
jgi:hypothetical protein